VAPLRGVATFVTLWRRPTDSATMKSLFRLCGLCALLVGFPVWAQTTSLKISRIIIKHVGPATVSDDLIRANIRVKPGDPYLPAAVDEDVQSLYATGLFYNVRVTAERGAGDTLTLTYVVQARPRLTAIELEGNKKLRDSKIKKKITSKVGEPLDEAKLFTDALAIQELYQKSGYPGTTVTNVVNIDEAAGRGTVTFHIKESHKIKITKVEFLGAQAFTQRKLRWQIKTRKHWMFSWLTGKGRFKEDQFEDDRDRLAEFYRDRGYLDFEIKDVEFKYPTPNTMVIRFFIYEGQQYKVGAVTFVGTTMLPTNAVSPAFNPGRLPKRGPDRAAWEDGYNLHRSFTMRQGDVFTAKGLLKDTEAIEDFYGAKGHIDVNTGSSGGLDVRRLANTQTGTMDLQFKVDEGQPTYVEKIEIRGNTKTKDRVIRRELAISPGELFNMVDVKRSKKRLEGLQYFDKVDTRPEDTTIPNRKNLVISVAEKNTGNLSVGAGFSSVDALVGFAEFTQGNFDLFHPPTFTGGGQKLRLRAQLGTQRQDYILSFVEPWFLDRKLALGTDLYYRDLNYQSLNNLYDERRAGMRLSLTRALWSDFLIGSLYYNIEDAGIILNGGLHGNEIGQVNLPGPGYIFPTVIPANVPQAILDEKGYSLLSRVGGSLAYDTRNSVMLPDHGQRTELTAEFTGGPLGGDKEFYKLELRTAWYFRGFFKGHVLEVIGNSGVADSLTSSDVPFYDRYYLGGLYSLRGFKYRGISPRDPSYGINPLMPDEPIGGDTYWFGSAEYSIPIVQTEKNIGVRFAFFYDIGNVLADPYNFDLSNFSDNWGVGLRLNLPIGPLRLDYGIPIHHDRFSSGSGRFQFGVGYTRGF
jgi:outer membrane protein insertion porin family